MRVVSLLMLQAEWIDFVAQLHAKNADAYFARAGIF